MVTLRESPARRMRWDGRLPGILKRPKGGVYLNQVFIPQTDASLESAR